MELGMLSGALLASALTVAGNWKAQTVEGSALKVFGMVGFLISLGGLVGSFAQGVTP